MSGLETAIRNALGKSDRSNPETRARIYQSARQALEHGLSRQGISDPEEIAGHRQTLEETIRLVEGEERERARVMAERATRRNPDLFAETYDQAPQMSEDMAPSLGGQTRDRPVSGHAAASGSLDNVQPGRSSLGPASDREPDPFSRLASSLDARRAPTPEVHADQDDDLPHMDAAGDDDEEALAPQLAGESPVVATRPRRRGWHTRLFIWATFFAFVGFGVWWVIASGLTKTAAERDTSVPNPPPTVTEEDFNGQAPTEPAGLKTLGPDSGFTKDWVAILKPGELSGITPHGAARAEKVATGDGPAVMITSRSTAADGKVEIAIPQAVTEGLPNGQVEFALTARSTNEPVQISIECDLGGKDCGRHRFVIPAQRTDVLFDLDGAELRAAGAAAKLLIAGDVEGKGAGIALLSVRLLPPR